MTQPAVIACLAALLLDIASSPPNLTELTPFGDGAMHRYPCHVANRLYQILSTKLSRHPPSHDGILFHDSPTWHSAPSND